MNIPVFLINLKKRKDRRESSLDFLNKLNLDDFMILKRAITGEESKNYKYKFIDKNIEDNISKTESTEILPTWNSLGCCISHYQCWKKMITLNLKKAIIIEDDNIITNLETAKYTLNKAINILQCKRDDPSLISLSSTSEMLHSLPGGWCIPLDKFYSTSFYLLNNECANLLINKTDMHGFKYQLDIQIGYWFNKTYCNHNSVYFCYHKNSGISQDSKLGSDVQIKYYTKYELYHILPLPIEIIDIIYKYLVILYDEQKILLKTNESYYGYRPI